MTLIHIIRCNTMVSKIDKKQNCGIAKNDRANHAQWMTMALVLFLLSALVTYAGYGLYYIEDSATETRAEETGLELADVVDEISTIGMYMMYGGAFLCLVSIVLAFMSFQKRQAADAFVKENCQK